MYKKVKWEGFDRNDSKLNCHFEKQPLIENFKQVKKNRAMIQVYLQKIQTRINRGYMKGAVQLFNRLIQIIDAPRWMVLALKEELERPEKNLYNT